MRARADCARLAADGLLRINRQPTDKAHARLRVGDVMTLPLRGAVRVIGCWRWPPGAALRARRACSTGRSPEPRTLAAAAETASYRAP